PDIDEERAEHEGEERERRQLDAAPDTGIYAGRAEREVEERERRRRAAVPAALVLDTTVTIHPGTVRLVTFDSEARRLVLRHSPSPALDRGR
ncbi:MAG TPA: hypothetical protein VFG84_02160, partial [Gemmatimonadaceae bacterium]|nr:hypothetical protein [Gemmatimonadaceae bacterium]